MRKYERGLGVAYIFSNSPKIASSQVTIELFYASTPTRRARREEHGPRHDLFSRKSITERLPVNRPLQPIPAMVDVVLRQLHRILDELDLDEG